MTAPLALTSPRIAALQQAIAAGANPDLGAFWRDVAIQGTPLIEQQADDPTHALVTFLWHGDATTENVVVFGALNVGWEVEQHRMSRLAETDVWYKTYRVRRDTRITYQLSLNDALLPLAEVTDWQARTATFRADPLNLKRWTIPTDPERADSTEEDLSILELPDAPPQQWITPRPTVRPGQVALHRFRSDLLANERRVWIYTPSDKAPDGVYDLLVLFDGSDYAGRHIPTPTILDNLVSLGHLRPMLAVLIDNLDLQTRHQELACDRQFLRCLVEELLPWVRRDYPVTTDPRRSIVGGVSLGALMAAYTALQRPDLFGNVLSQSGAYWWGPQWRLDWSPASGPEVEWEWLARQVAREPQRPVRFYLEVGRLELSVIRTDFPGQIAANRHLRDVLEAKGNAVTYAEFSGGHDYVSWRGSLADGLIALMHSGPGRDGHHEGGGG